MFTCTDEELAQLKKIAGGLKTEEYLADRSRIILACFSRDSIGGFINLFSFIMNPSKEKLEKVGILINLGLERS
ncbi:MAG: hypothetical protein WCR02_05875 [Sphaerochaetaceae bacterium]